MDLKERIKALCTKENVSMNQLEQELGYGKGYISKLGKSTPNAAKIQQLATRLGVSVEYLMTGYEPIEPAKDLPADSSKEHDVARKIENIIGDMNDPETSPLYFNGEKLDEKSLAILAQALTSAMKQVEIMRESNKKK